MRNDEKIGKTELTGIMVNLICMKLFLVFPRQILAAAGCAAWITSINVTLISLLIFYVVCKIYNTEKTIMEIAEKVGGRAFKIITGIIIFSVLLLNLCLSLRCLPESVRLILLHNTPMNVIVAVLCAAIAFGASRGIEALGRINALFLPILAVILFIFVILLFPSFDISNITPIFGKGIKEVFVDGLSTLSVFSDMLILNILMPLCKNKKDIKCVGIKSILYSGLTMTIIIFVLELIYPSPLAESFIMPVYQLTRLVSIGDFFSRIEAFFEFIWSITMFLYTSVYIYVLSVVWKNTFDLKYSKPVILPVIVIATAIAYIPESLENIIEMYTGIMMWIYTAAMLLPIFYGGVYRIFNKKVLRKEKKR